MSKACLNFYNKLFSGRKQALVGLACLLLLQTACTTSPPQNPNNICDMFDEKRSWYDDAKDAEKAWGSQVHTIMAFMYQESRFVADAKPPRKKILGFIPGPRKSSAYGYPQAKDETWKVFQRSTGKYSYDRDDFGDAAYFIGWYNHQSYLRNKIPKWDTAKLYLAYHEGNGGYARQTYKKKKWLMKVSKKVADQAWRYKKQLQGCEKRLKDRGWFW